MSGEGRTLHEVTDMPFGGPPARRDSVSALAMASLGAMLAVLLLFCLPVDAQLLGGPSALQAPRSAGGPADGTPLSQGERALGIRGESYPRLLESHPLTARVKAVFDRVLRVSGRRPGTIVELYVLDTPKILAEALPGGYVVASRGLVELAGQDDDALAFLLGHEVAHQILGHHDLLETRRRLAFQRSPGAPPGAPETTSTHQALELEADRLGVLFAALAGYRPRAAVPILQRVVEQAGSSPFHPDPRRRASDIRSTIESISDHVHLFDVGVLYLATGKYEAAIRTFGAFQSLFPSREVYSNLGLAYHRQAMLYGPPEELRRALVIDPGTRAAALAWEPQARRPRLRGGAEGSREPHPVFRDSMRRAITAYRLAVESDPEYAVGHLNLGAAHLDLGEYDFAIGEFKKALALDPQLKAAHLDRGVAYLKNADPARAEVDFRRAAELGPADPDPHVNLSFLYRALGRAEDARREAEAAAARASRQGQARSGAPSGRESLGSISVGQAEEQARRALGPAPTRVLSVPMGLGQEISVLVYDALGISLVSRNGRIEAMMVREGYAGRLASGVAIGAAQAEVEGRYGRPGVEDGTPDRRLWVFPSSRLVVLLQANRVAACWIH